MTDRVSEFLSFWYSSTAEEKVGLRQKFSELRDPHPIEVKFNASAEDILDAIESGSDLIQRGIRGIIADKAFYRYVVPQLKASGWTPETLTGDRPYDAALNRTSTRVTVQVKMQRREKQQPKTARTRVFPGGDDYWVVETQKTRGGKNAEGDATRPYRFGEFDILAVNLHPSTNDWSKFMYTVGRWLVPSPHNVSLIRTMQPVARVANDDWTDCFETCVDWMLSNSIKTIRHL